MTQCAPVPLELESLGPLFNVVPLKAPGAVEARREEATSVPWPVVFQSIVVKAQQSRPHAELKWPLSVAAR